MTPVALASRIEAVTVYRRGARVTRVAEVAPVEGAAPQVVRVGGLSLALHDSTVRARVEPTGGGGDGDGELPVAFDLRVTLEVSERDESLRPADDAALEAARAEVQELERLVDQIERERGRLAHLALVPRPAGPDGARPGPSPLDARLGLVELRARREAALDGELRETRDRLERAELRLAELEDQDRRASGARQPREHELRKAVLVSLRGGGGPCRLVLEYMVPGASWAPVYALRLAGGMSAARLSMRAQVAQNTGEDWTQVAMMLSTAEAQAWTELPELSSLRIGRRQAPPRKLGWRPPPAGVEELYRDWDRAFAGGRGAPAAPARSRPARRSRAETGRYARGGASDFDEQDTAVLRMSAPAPAVARPPAPPMAAPAAPAPAPMAASLSYAAAPPVVGAAAPPPAAKKMRARAAPGGPAREESAAMPAEPAPGEEASLTAPAELLRYGELRMPPPQAAGRGRLVPAQRRDLYLELLIEQRVSVRIDVVQAIRAATERAERAATRLPPGRERAWADAFDHAYPAQARVDVPSDGDPHSIPLADAEARCEPRYVVVPREASEVFRTARIENPLPSPLLPGPVDVYLRGEFLLASRLDMTPARGHVTLGLGVEQGIKVARNTRFREETAGLIGGALVLHHQILIELRNNLPTEAPIEVRERIPVSEEKDDEVEVKVTAASPRWEEWEQELARPGEERLRGGRRWRVTVPPGGRSELRADYEVRISSKNELAGGNRREA